MNYAFFWSNPNNNDHDFISSIMGVGEQLPVPTKLRVSGEVRPCLPHIGEEVFDLLANDAICDIVNCLTNLGRNDRSRSLAATRRKGSGRTMSLPRPIVNVIPTPFRSGEDVLRMRYADE